MISLEGLKIKDLPHGLMSKRIPFSLVNSNGLILMIYTMFLK